MVRTGPSDAGESDPDRVPGDEDDGATTTSRYRNRWPRSATGRPAGPPSRRAPTAPLDHRIGNRLRHTWGVERAFSAPTEADQAHLYEVIADLGTYPNWLDLVSSVEPVDPSPADPAEMAWSITLRARIGPLARSKRLRMVRTVADGEQVRFERQELDGRQHSTWVLAARVGPADRAPWRSTVTLDLHYGGSLWSGLLDAVLQSAADDATERLQAYVTAPA